VSVNPLQHFLTLCFLLFLVIAFKVASWNVVSLRSLIRNNPTALDDLVKKYNIDMLCLQETKLQESHLDDPKNNLGEILKGYKAYYSYSTVKKGYAGTAVYIREYGDTNPKKQKITSFFAAKDAASEETTKTSTESNVLFDKSYLTPEHVSFGMGIDKHDGEGRLIVVDFCWGTLCNVYIPNAGQDLVRLSYRTDEWDKAFLLFIQRKQQERNLPIMWLGDMNIAHTNLECWNDGAKHLAKQPGITPEERASFQAQLDSGFVDAFRRLHPTAEGHYSYWSQRAGNRPPNKGLRLDYFVCDEGFFDEGGRAVVRDSYMDSECMGSDHCPVILEIELKKG
jgi:exodeoxyribonuclease III